MSWQASRRHVESQLSGATASSDPAAVGRRSGAIREPGRKSVAAAQSGIWRLLAPNNRELARSAQLYPSAEAALAHVTELQSLLGELETRIVHGVGHGEHLWVATLDRHPMITAARAYEGAAAARSAAAGALAALAAVGRSPEVVVAPPLPRHR